MVSPNSLAYGLYKFVIRVDVLDSVYGTLSRTASEFIEIIPSGFVTYGLKSGAFSQSIGLNQTFTFSPAEFSFDLDQILQASNLNFQFYCLNVISLLPSSPSLTGVESLIKFKNDSTLQINSSINCFESEGSFLKILNSSKPSGSWFITSK